MPVDPGEFRFIGVDGRGSQELIQDPGRGRGAAIVRIQDPNGGAEGYTFDLVWRGAGFGPSPTGPPMRQPMAQPMAPPQGGRAQGASPNSALRACQDAVRQTANQQYGLRDIEFGNLDAQDNPGRNDTIIGSFDVRRGNFRDTYRFSCGVDLANGTVRGVDISRGGAEATADRYAGGGATSACQRAAEQRIQKDGYRNVQFGSLSADNRRNDWIAGTARAQLGNNGRLYDFDIGCAVNLANGSIQSVQATRR